MKMKKADAGRLGASELFLLAFSFFVVLAPPPTLRLFIALQKQPKQIQNSRSEPKDSRENIRQRKEKSEDRKTDPKKMYQ